jgi:hypothetical protein
MATTKIDILKWLLEGSKQGATHLVVATDTWDWEDYPVYVMPDQDVLKIVADHAKVMEVYKLSLDWRTQLDTYRAYNV